MRAFFAKLWSLRREFAKYFIIGFSAFVLDVGSLALLKNLLGIRPTIAVIINQPIILLYVFYLNKRWSFKATGLTHLQMIRFFTVAAMNYLISIGWMWLFNHVLEFQYLLVRTANIAVAVAWNFLLYKYWVYAVYKPKISS